MTRPRWPPLPRLGRRGHRVLQAEEYVYAPGGLPDFRVRPNFKPVILNPTTGEVVSS